MTVKTLSKSEKSESLAIKCGVPQGSVLGLLLFLIYMNDISRSSEILSIILFAGDKRLFFSQKKPISSKRNHEPRAKYDCILAFS